VPPGENTKWTVGLPLPAMVTVTVALPPAARVPDMGETTTFFSRPGGSETDQVTGPPEAVSVMVPLAGGARSTVSGVTLNEPAAADVLASAEGDAAADGAAEVREGALAVVLPALGVAGTAVVLPATREKLTGLGAGRLATVVGVATTAGRAGGGVPWCGGRAATATADATAAAVPVAAPACARRVCHHAFGGASGTGNPLLPNVHAAEAAPCAADPGEAPQAA
jgi:hypothetical protein